MKIKRVVAEDTLALGKVTFSLEDRGLILLQGDNKDDPSANSNGAGKSSLTDVISWVFWGSTARGVSGDGIIRNGAKSARGEIIVEDEDAGEQWTIQRTRKKNKEVLEVFQWDASTSKWEPRTLGTIKLTQELVQRILGCSQEVFKAAIYVGQEALVDLPMLTDKALKELIEEAAGVRILEQAYECARQRLRKVQDETSNLKSVLSGREARLDVLRDALAAEEDHGLRWERDRTEQLKADQTALDALADAIEDGESTIEALKPSVIQWKTKLDELTRELAGYTREREREQELAKALATAERNRDLKAAALRRVVEEVKQRKTELACIESKVGTPCPECGTPMTADHVEHAKTATGARIKGALDTVATERAAWEALKEVVEAAKTALDAHRATMRNPSAVSADRDVVIKALSTAEDDIRKLEHFKEDHKRISIRLEEWRTAINPHAVSLVKLQDQIRNLESDIKGLNDDLSKLETQERHESLAVEVFSPKGVRAHILDEVTPFLNDRTATYLGTLSDGMITATWSTLQVNGKGEVKERFAIDVSHARGGKSFAALSGGQKRKVRLACALALQDLVASRATKPFKLWVGDEIDEALDTAGLERLMMVLQEKAKERGTVVVISHSDLRDWISQVWTMKMENEQAALVV